MALTVLAMNAEGAFGDPNHAQAALDFIATQNPDVAFLGESHWEQPLDGRAPDSIGAPKHPHVVHESFVALQALGYHVLVNSDHEASPTRRDRTGFMGIVRRTLGQGTIISMGTRDAYAAEVTDPATGKTVRLVGQHFDDKDEQTRLGHVAALPANANVLMGDLNSMHRRGRVARVLRLLKPAAGLIPTWEYDFTHAEKTIPNKIKTILHLGKRLVDMATGKAMQTLADRGLRDADPTHQPTMDKGPFQLDHIMVDDSIAVRDFTIHDGFPSDHRPISAVLTTVA